MSELADRATWTRSFGCGHGRIGSAGSVIFAAAALSACSAAGEAPAEASETGAPTRIEARVVVSRSTTGDVEAGEAMAHFARTSAGSGETLAAAGLVEPTPEVGTCEVPTGAFGSVGVGGAIGSSSAVFTTLGEVQLLDVGEVTLTAELGEAEAPTTLSLAPRAFPSISSFASGVVYTSRDRSAQALPSGVDYRIAVSGGSELPSFEIESAAPAELQDVTLGGEPLVRVHEIQTGTPLDVTWGVEPGSDADVVTVDLSDDQAVRVRCAFADEIGSGTIPAEWLREVSGEGRISVHRQRVVEGSLTALDGNDGAIRLGFDFELNVAVSFTDE